jgi:hypothetical protein
MVVPIAQIQQVVDTFLAAADANRATPAREGNVIVLRPESAEDVMITADLHGHRRNFQLILRAADLDGHPGRHLVLQEVCHGGPTYPGGGCMSHGLLEEVAKLKVKYPDRVHFLLSNHELAELTEYPIVKGKKMLNVLFRQGLAEMYGAASEKVREAFGEFIGSCPLAVRIEQGAFVCHSAPEEVDKRAFDSTVFQRPLGPADFGDRGAAFALVWGRDFRPENAEAFARLVKANVLIHGHEPAPEGVHAPNARQVILDCTGDPACYALLEVGKSWTQVQVLEQVKTLQS